MCELGGQGLLVALFILFLGLALGLVRVPEHVFAVLVPFGLSQRGDELGGGGQRVGAGGIGTGFNQIKNLLVSQADARHRALLAQFVDVEQNRQNLGGCTGGNTVCGVC